MCPHGIQVQSVDINLTTINGYKLPARALTEKGVDSDPEPKLKNA